MPKYYVQSGSLELATNASDARAAAIWAVHRALSPAFAFLDESGPVADRSTPAASQLGPSIQVNERGLDRTDGRDFETLAIVCEWTQLLIAVDRLQARMERRELCAA